MLGDHPFDYTSDSSLGIVHIAYISTTRFVNIHHVFSVANDRDLESILTLQSVSPVLEGQSVVNPLRVTLWTLQMRVTATLRSYFFRSSGSSDERVSNSGPAHSHHKRKLFSDEANPEEHSPCRSDDELSPKSMSAVIQTKQTLILVDRMMNCLQNHALHQVCIRASGNKWCRRWFNRYADAEYANVRKVLVRAKEYVLTHVWQVFHMGT